MTDSRLDSKKTPCTLCMNKIEDGVDLVDKKQIGGLLEVDHPCQWQFEKHTHKVMVKYKHLKMLK